MKTPLLPCRDCQQPAVLYCESSTPLPWQVQCDICGIQVGAITIDLVVKGWNDLQLGIDLATSCVSFKRPA